MGQYIHLFCRDNGGGLEIESYHQTEEGADQAFIDFVLDDDERPFDDDAFDRATEKAEEQGEILEVSWLELKGDLAENQKEVWLLVKEYQSDYEVQCAFATELLAKQALIDYVNTEFELDRPEFSVEETEEAIKYALEDERLAIQTAVLAD